MHSISILGICWDKKSSFLRGPALAPARIRHSLHNGASNLYAESGTLAWKDSIRDEGDLVPASYEDIAIQAEKCLQNGKLLSLGGDHSISYPLLKAHHKYHKDIHILHIDAHPDLYQEFEGDPYSHACPFARIMEDGLASRLIQLGIRTLNPPQRAQAEKYGVEILEMKDYQLESIPPLTQPVYLSLDMDAIDPAYAPGVSHHEPGGFSSRQIIELIQSIAVPIIGADIVEYNPVRDVQDMTATLAAKLMKEILVKMNTIP